MPLTNEQKEVLRERMKIAREAKLAKKQAVKTTVNEEKTPAPAPAPAPAAAPAIKPTAPPVVEMPFEEPLPKARIVKDKEPASKENKPSKTKYAKLVFYQEPTAKKMKKLSKVLEDSSSDDEVKVVVNKPQTQVAQPQPQPPVDLRKQRMEQLSKMSKIFFD